MPDVPAAMQNKAIMGQSYADRPTCISIFYKSTLACTVLCNNNYLVLMYYGVYILLNQLNDQWCMMTCCMCVHGVAMC